MPGHVSWLGCSVLHGMALAKASWLNKTTRSQSKHSRCSQCGVAVFSLLMASWRCGEKGQLWSASVRQANPFCLGLKHTHSVERRNLLGLMGCWCFQCFPAKTRTELRHWLRGAGFLPSDCTSWSLIPVLLFWLDYAIWGFWQCFDWVQHDLNQPSQHPLITTAKNPYFPQLQVAHKCPSASCRIPGASCQAPNRPR